MGASIDNGILETTVSRRGFLGGAGGLTFAFAVGGAVLARAPELLVGAAEAAPAATRLNVWATVGTDDLVTVMLPVAEMGQGVYTALPLILAEELDAEWTRVRVEYAPPIPKIYGNFHPLFGGAMVTAASIAIPGYYMPLRIAGAQARRVLLDNAARHWNVPAGELSTEPSVVVHAPSGRRISYGEVAKFATVPAELPKITEGDLKKPSRFRLIGRTDLRRIDVPSKVNGTAVYGIDVRVPGMVYASLLPSPAEGAKPDKVNVDEVMKIRGVTRVAPMPFGVAVLGDTVEATLAGRRALKVSWDTSGAVAAGFDSEGAKKEYARHGRDPDAKAIVAHSRGEAGKALAGAAKTIEAEYWSEHCYHAQMEPMNCVARVAADGQSAEIWTGTQAIALAAAVAAGVLKTTPDRIRVHQHMLGGGFGRRVAPDAVAAAVALSNLTKQPVKLMLSREDDVAAARPRPMTYQLLRAGLDAQGRVLAMHHRLVAENVDAFANPPRFKASGGRDLIGWAGIDLPMFYGIPNVTAECVRETRGMRVWPWRAIGAGYTQFAVESFVDEIAHATGVDPLALRLDLAKGNPRAHAVIRTAAEMAQWTVARKPGRALGMAFSEFHGTFTAGVAEVSVDRKTGRIRVHDYWIAADAGLVIHPENVHAQLESAVVYGLGASLFEELTVRAGAVQQRNFHDYRVPRMSDVPEIHTRIVASDAAPTGMGEMGVPSVAPAIANAMFRLTGRRLRNLPMSPERVLKALA